MPPFAPAAETWARATVEFEHLHQMRALAQCCERIEKGLKDAGSAQPPEPFPDRIPMAELHRKGAPGDVVDRKIMQRFQKLPGRPVLCRHGASAPPGITTFATASKGLDAWTACLPRNSASGRSGSNATSQREKHLSSEERCYPRPIFCHQDQRFKCLGLVDCELRGMIVKIGELSGIANPASSRTGHSAGKRRRGSDQGEDDRYLTRSDTKTRSLNQTPLSARVPANTNDERITADDLGFLCGSNARGGALVQPERG